MAPDHPGKLRKPSGDELTERIQMDDLPKPDDPVEPSEHSIEISVDIVTDHEMATSAEKPDSRSRRTRRQAKTESRPGRSPSDDGTGNLRTGPGRLVRSGQRSRPRSAVTGPRPQSVNDTDPNLGRILGSYKVLSLIGSGGMGQVYFAEHVILGRKVALKLLRAEYAVKRDAVHRFFQEARAVNTIGHDNIVDITDFVELDTGETFFIMELLKGQDLSDLLRNSRRPVPLNQAIRMALQVCDGLEAAHNANIIHRDLKPDNIFILDTHKEIFVKILDFGVAKLQGHDIDNSWQTAAGSVIGTPAYMSPEQASSIPVDNRSDIYSLGAILYELFTGHPVFRAKSFGEYVVKHMNDIPIPPRQLPDAPRIPSPLEKVILRCLEKDPDRRYQSVVDLRKDLQQATANVETVVKHVPTSTGHRRRPVVLLTTIAGVLLLAATAFILASGITHDSGDPVAETKAPVALPPDIGAPARQLPDQRLPKAMPIPQKTAHVVLRTEPAGAKVYRDGNEVSIGTTPLERTEIVGEVVRFEFRLPDFAPAEEVVRVAEGNNIVHSALNPNEETTQNESKPNKKVKSSGKKTAPKRRGSSKSTRRKTLRKKRGPSAIRPGDQVNPFK